MLDEDFNAILHNFAFIWFSDSCFSLLNTRKPKDVGIFIEDRVKNYFFFFFSREREIFPRRMRKTYIHHLLVAEAIRLRRVLRDGPHGQTVSSEQPFRRL